MKQPTATLDVSLSRFGDNLAITAPPKTQIGSIKS